jgi:hypothetical protein
MADPIFDPSSPAYAGAFPRARLAEFAKRNGMTADAGLKAQRCTVQ